ncbi:neurotrophin 1 isoform X1 [Drosophila subobscura]|uniref:neurotrophin 1 isoform X1 n=1 Tax=Drosophila subobscura TaxID=7241 RepID=UPI00155B08FA|nr:neurotrophin 1 isoform X1 [Drosophila subobscura]
MKAGRAFGCLFWALLYCVLYLDLVGGSSSSDEELLDFDFADAKDQAAADDWQLEDLEEQQQADHKLESNMLDFSVDLDEPEPERQAPQFDWREKVLRNALAKALTDEGLRQKFIEVMPILRVLSSQQRLALSALISAQMNAKQGHDLRLEQVRMMFGNDKKLILPIVYDLANLVKSSTRKYLNLESDLAAASASVTALLQAPSLQRRQDQLTVVESEQDDRVGTIDVSGKPEGANASVQPEVAASLEDFFEEMQSDVLDPQMINEALQSAESTQRNSSSKDSKRVRRSANEFVHKLTRSVPLSVTEQQLLGGIAGRTVRLNTTSFQQSPSSSNQSYVEIEDLAFAGLNGTEVLPLSADERLDLQRNSGEESLPEEPLPSPEELIAGPRYRLGKRPSPGQKSQPVKRKRLQTGSLRGRPKTSASSHKPQVVPPLVVAQRKCERFTSNMCIRTDDYPLEQIMGSIRRHKNAMSALLAEFYDKPNNNLEFGDDFDDFSLNKKRREDEGSSAGGMCLSVVRYARPQKAKSASGEWKYIVNTGQHTQTLRLEKCSNPGESCSYLAQTYRSHCSQVYNYHRLLSWDKVRGLHVDIFKVPTCCSCQVDGYRQQFPPLSSIQAKDYSPLANYKPVSVAPNGGYSTINEEDLDYADESDEDELALGLSYPTFNGRDTNELYAGGSKKLRGASTSVGPYLSPPDDDVEEEQQQQRFSGYKGHGHSHKSPGASSKKYYSQVSSRRRPHQQQQQNEARVDLDLAPSEMHTDQEVNVNLLSAAGEKPIQRQPINRKRIYTSTHPNTAAAAAAASSSTSSAGGVRLRVPQTTSLPARTGTAAAISSHTSGHATHAHQAAAAAAAAAFPSASSTAATSQPAFVQRNQQHFNGGGKSRPRFYAPPATTPVAVAPNPISVAASPASPLPTERTTKQQQQHQQQQQGQQQQHKSTAFPQPPTGVYHVNSNSIYTSSSSSSSADGPSNGTKRINYNYHPIIDFFEKSSSRRAEPATAAPGGLTDYDMEESQLMEQRVYPQRPAGAGMATGVFQHPIPIQPTISHERRMGFGGAGAGSVGGAGGVAGFANDNAWQPMVVAS